MRPHRNTLQTEIDESLIDDFSSEAPVADFPQTELQPLQASTDIDWNGVAIYNLGAPIDCPCCENTVVACRAYGQKNGEFILTCPTCLHELGLLEEC